MCARTQCLQCLQHIPVYVFRYLVKLDAISKAEPAKMRCPLPVRQASSLVLESAPDFCTELELACAGDFVSGAAGAAVFIGALGILWPKP